MADLNKMAEELVNLTVKEVNELATILKDEHGIEPAAAAVGRFIHTSPSRVSKKCIRIVLWINVQKINIKHAHASTNTLHSF